MSILRIESISVPEGKVSRIDVGGVTLWKPQEEEHYIYSDIPGIRFTGEQIINTGVYVTEKTRIEIGVKRISRSAEYLFGIMSADGLSSVSAYMYTNGKWCFGATYTTCNLTAGLAYDMVQDAAGVSRNGQLYKNRAEVTPFTAPRPLVIGACQNEDGSILGKYFTGEIYYLRIYEDGVLIRDYVPKIRSDFKCGLWENVRGVFALSSTGVAFERAEV